jgi:hypothetical protein
MAFMLCGSDIIPKQIIYVIVPGIRPKWLQFHVQMQPGTKYHLAVGVRCGRPGRRSMSRYLPVLKRHLS